MKRATVGRIADLAKVSTATVSRVLNGSGPVASPTRQRVLDAAIRLGAGMPAPVVGIVIRDIENPFFAQLAAHLQDELIRRERLPLVLTTRTQNPADDLDESAPYMLLAVKATGIINVGADHQSKARVSEFAKLGLPTVMFAEPQAGAGQNTDYLSVDSVPAMKDVIRHLRDSGHRRLVFLGGSSDTVSARERLAAFREAGEALGYNDQHRLERTGDYRPDDGRRLVAELQTMPATDRPTAVIACNDLMALGVLQACGTYSMDVPAQFSVVGYDNTPVCELVHPTLASLAPPVDTLARVAVDRLLERTRATSEGQAPRAGRHVVEARFWVRDRASVGPAPADR